MAGVLPLPRTIEAITPEWIEAALRRQAPGISLRGAEVVDVLHGTSTKVRLRLDLDDAGRAAGIPGLVILKGGFEPHSPSMPYMHKQEVHAYADVAPVSPLRSPACYFAAFEEASGQGIVIMDDLVARGVDFCHAQRPQSPDLVAQRLSMLARHHALTWGSRDIEPGGKFDWARPVIDGFQHYAAQLLTPEVWQGYIDSSRGAAASVRFHGLEWFKRVLDQVGILCRQQPNVLLHGDTHLGNLYIDIDGEPGFFDSQPHLAPAMHEIAYHLTCALDVPDRRAHERELVAYYRGELIRAGVSPPPLEELMRQYGCFLAIGYGIFLLNASQFQPEAINTAYTARFSAAMLDHDTIALIEAIG